MNGVKRGKPSLRRIAFDFLLGQISEHGFTDRRAVRGKVRAHGRAHGDDGVRRVDAVEAEDASGAGHGEADGFVRAARHFREKSVRLRPQRSRFHGFRSELVQFQTEAVSFVVRGSFDQVEFFHGVQQAMDRGFVQIERGGEFGDA